MKLQPALIFGEHMVLQRDEPIPVWGRSVRDDRVTVTLNGIEATGTAENGCWTVTLPPMGAAEKVTMTIASALTGENIVFSDVAVGEVWIAGGQSNMEFLLKYDGEAETMAETAPDDGLRFFRYPTAAFVGAVEKEPYPDDGFWRRWDSRENKLMFGAPAAYMGRKLREALGVPVGFVGVNWGGTPAAAWTAMEDLKANPALTPVLEWYEESLKELNLPAYYAASDQPDRIPTPEEVARTDEFMTGVFAKRIADLVAAGKDIPPMPPFPPQDYTPYMPGPRGAIRPAGLYDCMLRKVAPYAARGVIWYQGEDDDFRGWQAFYDESMKTLIGSWRKLWKKELPFFQVELAPFKGWGVTGAKEYHIMREKQRAAADALPGVRDVCIMDAGDSYNIHVRKKRPVGERLALLARKYVYGETELIADSPRMTDAARTGEGLRLRFRDAGEGLKLSGDLEKVLILKAGDRVIPWTAEVSGDTLTLTAELPAGEVTADYLQMNDCEAALFGGTGLPAFPFTARVP